MSFLNSYNIYFRHNKCNKIIYDVFDNISDNIFSNISNNIFSNASDNIFSNASDNIFCNASDNISDKIFDQSNNCYRYLLNFKYLHRLTHIWMSVWNIMNNFDICFTLNSTVTFIIPKASTDSLASCPEHA